MHDESLRCDFCRGPIPAQDLLHGRAVIIFQKKYCKTCMTAAVQRGRNHAEARAAAPTPTATRASAPAPLPRETVPAAVAREEVESALSREIVRADPPAPRPVPAPQATRRLKTGEHGCCFYSSEEDRRHELGPYLREGIENNEKVLHFLRTPTPEKVLGDFRAIGLSMKPYIAGGQIQVVPVAKLLDAEGFFEPSKVVDRILQEADRALEDGYSRLRIAGEMTWALGMDVAALVEYEEKLTALAARGKVTALCQYNVYRFDVESLGTVRKQHPFVYVKGTAAMVVKELEPSP